MGLWSNFCPNHDVQIGDDGGVCVCVCVCVNFLLYKAVSQQDLDFFYTQFLDIWVSEFFLEGGSFNKCSPKQRDISLQVQQELNPQEEMVPVFTRLVNIEESVIFTAVSC